MTKNNFWLWDQSLWSFPTLLPVAFSSPSLLPPRHFFLPIAPSSPSLLPPHRSFLPVTLSSPSFLPPRRSFLFPPCRSFLPVTPSSPSLFSPRRSLLPVAPFSPSLLHPRHSFLPVTPSSPSLLPPHHPFPFTIPPSIIVVYSGSGDIIYINRPTLDMVITWSRYLEIIIWLHKQLISTLSKLNKMFLNKTRCYHLTHNIPNGDKVIKFIALNSSCQSVCPICTFWLATVHLNKKEKKYS